MQNGTDLFKENSWHSVLTGMGVIPEGYDPIVDNVDYLALISSLGNMEKSIQAAARQQIPHKEFLDKLLAS